MKMHYCNFTQAINRLQFFMTKWYGFIVVTQWQF